MKNQFQKKSVTDFFDSSNNSENKKVFILFLCDNNYKKKDIDSLTKKICEILEEGAFDKAKTDILINAIRFRKIDDIKFIKKIPVDKRHSTKVDYNTLMKMI